MKKTIEMVMSPNIHSIGSDIALGVAREQMKRFQIRHLPVLRAGAIVGILSDRDLLLMSKFSGSENFTVEDAMTADPFVAEPDTLLSEVVAVMAERKIGSVIVADNNKPVGIFTATDGMKLLAAIYK